MRPLLWWVAAAALALALLPVPAKGADRTEEHRFVELVTQERDRAGTGSLAVKGDLVEVARRHADRMATEGRLHHNPRLGQEVDGWQALGENVGRGGEVNAVHTAFMDSPSHRANILDRRFTEIGVGVVVRDDELWVVQIFRLPQPAQPARAPVEAARPPRPVVAAAPAAPPPQPPPQAPTTTTTAVTAPADLRPPVAGLPRAPARTTPAADVLGEQALPVPPLPEIPPATKLAASLLVVVVAAQVATLRRLRLV